jgi:hypothetical protein
MNNIMTELCPSDEKDAVKEIINATVFMPVSKGWKYSTRKKTPSWKYYYVHSDYDYVLFIYSAKACLCGKTPPRLGHLATASEVTGQWFET